MSLEDYNNFSMEDKKPNKIVSWLDNVDDKAKNKGKWWHTLWQYIKFSAVGIFITLIQLALVNLLYFFMKSWTTPLTGFIGDIFSESTLGEGHSTWGYLLPFFLSNFIANTIGYFLNKKRTFKSDAPKWHYVIYIIVLVLLITFSTWLQGVITNGLVSVNAEFIAPTIAALTVGMMQSIILFPLQKFILLKEKKQLETPNASNNI